ncbi:hypothetical protein D1872_181510 [compost metagenome]
MKLKFEYNNICAACKSSRRKDDLVFDPESLEPYCSNIQACNNHNPNSYANVLARGNQTIQMITYKEALEKHNERLLQKATPTEVEVLKIISQPTTARITEVEDAEHVVMIRQRYGLKHVSKAIVRIIEEHREALASGWKPKAAENLVPVDMEPSRPDPKPKPEPEPEVEDTPEDEMTF